MTAEDTLRRNKTGIIAILCSDRTFILNKVHEKKLITKREYNNLLNINNANDEGHVVALVDKIMNKGEDTCRDFLDLLQTDKEIKETFPDLSKMQLHDAGPLTKPVQVSSGHREMFLGQDSKRPKMDGVYPLNSRPVGLCLIMNNENFTTENQKVRNGSDKDAQSLAEVFSELGFRVLMCKDQTKDQMDQTLTWFASQTDPVLPPKEFEVKEWSDAGFIDCQQPLNHGDAFICCVLSHGVEDAVLGTDGGRLSVKNIKKIFEATEQSPLKGKPKVFLIQACEGKAEQREESAKNLEQDSSGATSIPVTTDFLVAVAAAEDNPTTDGSRFIQSVCRQLRESCPSGEDLLTILQHANGDVGQKEGSDEPDNMKRIPQLKSTLRKKLVFSPRHT